VYQAYPNQTPLPEAAPMSVRQAVYLMYAGAVVYLISGIVGLIVVINAAPGTFDGGRPPAESPVPGAVISALSVVTVVGVALSLVVPVVLWLWMAWKCKAGRPWARVVSTVLFALATWATLTALAGSTGAWGLLGAIVSWFIGLGVIILLWQRSSSYYFHAPSRY
jgi:hypothetical protein